MRAARHAQQLQAKEVVFRLVVGIVVGRLLWQLAASIVDMALPLMHGIAGENSQYLGYLNLFPPNYEPLHVQFRGYDLMYEGILAILAALVIGAVIAILLIAYAHREWPKGEAEGESEDGNDKWRACPQCLGLIPAAARRCARCRSQLGPRAGQPADSN